MHHPDTFSALIAEIESLGYDCSTASYYAKLIGDTPITDEHGFTIVMDQAKPLARLPLTFFGESPGKQKRKRKSLNRWAIHISL